MEIIAQNIKDSRKALELTQQSFADSVHITRCAVGSYEEDRATPSIEVLIRMCKLFNVTLDDFCNSGLVKKDINVEDEILLIKDEIERIKEFIGLDQFR